VAKHFYRVDYDDGNRKGSVCGSTELDPTAFIAEISSAAFIRLDDLVYRDNQQRVRSWTEWDPHTQPTIFINCKFIHTVMPLSGDPFEEQSTAP
jgi:hypothetical protein